MSVRAPAGRRRAQAAQPRLPMVVPSAGYPGRIAMEIATPCESAFDGDDWCFSVDWEGSRCLLMADAHGSVHLQGEMASLDDRFPEIVAAGPLRGGHAAVLEGSICVLDDQGRPDLQRLSQRITAGATRPPAVFLVSDLLHLDGESLMALPLGTRLERVHALIPAHSRVQLPDGVVAHGTALAAAAAERGLGGLVARRLDSPYRAGLASPERLRIALTGRRDFVVLGWYSTPMGLQLALGDWAGGTLAAAGVAAVEGGSSARWLSGAVEVTGSAPTADTGPWSERRVTWLRPRLVATVDPVAGPTAPDAVTRTWRLVSLRDDVDPRWCVRRPPVAPPKTSVHQLLRPFSPTVLSALPLDGAA